MEIIKDILGKVTNYTFDFEYLDILEDAIERIDNMDDDDEIFNALDDALIWTHSQWTIIKHHCSPNNASLEDAFGLTQEDIYRYIYLYKKYAI